MLGHAAQFTVLIVGMVAVQFAMTVFMAQPGRDLFQRFMDLQSGENVALALYQIAAVVVVGVIFLGPAFQPVFHVGPHLVQDHGVWMLRQYATSAGQPIATDQAMSMLAANAAGAQHCPGSCSPGLRWATWEE